jgi:hypothetical protein
VPRRSTLALDTRKRMHVYQLQPAFIAHLARKYASRILLLLSLAVIVYARATHQLLQWWFLVIAGIALLAFELANFKSGTTTLMYSTVRRGEDPVGFWTATVISICAGLCLAAVGLAEMAGLWSPPLGLASP